MARVAIVQRLEPTSKPARALYALERVSPFALCGLTASPVVPPPLYGVTVGPASFSQVVRLPLFGHINKGNKARLFSHRDNASF